MKGQSTAPALAWWLKCEVIEFLGNDEHIHATSDDTELVAILNAHSDGCPRET